MNTNHLPPVLGDVGVIALVPDRWSLCWQARHQIASRLARYFHVVWVDYPWLRKELLGAAAPEQAKIERPGFQIYRPGRLLPNLGRPAWLGRWTSRQRLRRASTLLRDRGCSRIVLYLWRSEFADAINQVPHQLSCYHIDDEYSFSSVEVEPDPVELRLIRSVSQVFIHSPAMVEKKGKLNPSTEFVPNGVDFQRFASPVPEPADLEEIPHPRIGYTGSLKRMINWSLLQALSGSHPEWSFVFVGPTLDHPEIKGTLAALSRRRNVHFLGAKPSDATPGYVQHFDVCIMPYRLDDYTKYIYPLKLHEYLAGGKPVVAAPIPALEAFKQVIALGEGSDEWSRAITQALSGTENTPARTAARRDIARMHDWDILVERIAGILARRLGLSLPHHGEVSDDTLPATMLN
jgi:glycosyltransferase involved in cell wall biosynthesis